MTRQPADSMLRNRLYYGIKPLLPFAVRLPIRRWFALRKRSEVGTIWPIKHGSEVPPPGWQGWPDGKQFALVLTHDVEGISGLNKCQQVMDLERKLGFHSAFNLIPEGEYSTTPEFRKSIERNGFEVGVHDLYHDGKLFLTKKEFSRRAIQINRYIKDWNTAGFRSGFMLHNLDWIHDLNVQYDASTFDVDPFEPQPHGRHTIFPFWVPRNGNGTSHHAPGPREVTLSAAGTSRESASSGSLPGYVELPYTIPQDSTLFLLLAERHPDIWLQKLDWVARHGGMALVNVHPDYLRFDGEPLSSRTYPAEFYSRFLEYARQRYGTSFWHPLPREMAAFVAQGRWLAPQRPKRICMVTYSHFLSDARVTRYAEALAERGDHVDVVALKRSPEEPRSETVGKVRLVRMQPRLGKNEKARLSFLVPVLRFLFSSSFWIARQHSRIPYDVLHIHNVPDFLVFAAWYPKLTGAKVILDIHDIVPEFYSSKFGASDDSAAVRLLKWSECRSARFADHVIISNHLWRDKYVSRTGLNGNCSVFINNVDARIFQPRPRARNDGKTIILFPGGLQWHQGLDIAIRAFQKLLPEVPEAEFHIYGDGNMKDELVSLASRLGLADKVRFFNPLPVRQIADIMANADLGVVPKRADSFGNEAYSTKIMEFLSLGIPVVVSSTKIDRFYFNDSVVRFFESGNEKALTQAMLEVIRNQKLRESLAQAASGYVAVNSWEQKTPEYLSLVDSLTTTE
jgi:glycosyltransferase involved in cell wall biosynthesis